MSICDTPSNSLKDSNVSPKVKTMEEKRIGVHFLFRNTFGVKGACWSSKIRIKRSDKWVIYSYRSAQTKVG
jgi:hypothetical protein